jgi:hypothetical protein
MEISTAMTAAFIQLWLSWKVNIGSSQESFLGSLTREASNLTVYSS